MLLYVQWDAYGFMVADICGNFLTINGFNLESKGRCYGYLLFLRHEIESNKADKIRKGKRVTKMIQGRNQKEIVKKIVSGMQEEKYDAILLTAPDAIFYATGFASPFLYKSDNTGLTIAVITAEGKVYLILSEFEKQSAGRVTEDIELIAYPTWIYIEDYAKAGQKKEVQPDVNRSYRLALSVLPEKKEGLKIGVQQDYIKIKAWEYLRANFKEEQLPDITQFLIRLRSVKTEWEIRLLREAARMSEIAMIKTARETTPGMTDTEVTALFRRYCLEQSNEITGVSQAHTFADDFAPAWITSGKVLKRGDVIRLDGGPELSGYNSDIARTFAVGGTTSSENEKIYEKLWKGYEAARKTIAPGVPRKKVFQAVQEAIAKEGIENYIRGHHGHSLGCAKFSEEYPFISPDDERPFEPGMVFCIEVPYYSSRHHSYNIEDTFLVTENGIEYFTNAIPTLYL